jgi:3-(3-hydroxy-phenyl)propionate hydroxylase
VQGDLQRDAVHYYQSKQGILVMVPLYNGRFRVFTAGPPDLKSEDVTEKLLQEYVDKRGPEGLVLNDVSWRTAFSIHARHTDRFNVGRVYLAGDAAHVHSPAGGQGLNTGVTDAHNLAWKLAFVHKELASRALLDTYGAERATVASAVVKQAEAQTKAWMLKKRWQIVLRDSAARLAEWTGLFDRYYSPWLAGLTNHYPESLAVSGPTPRRTGPKMNSAHNGQLAPDVPVLVDGEGVPARLRDVLPTDRYTALVFTPRGDTPRSLVATLRQLVSEHGDLVTSRTVTGDGVLTDTLSTHETPLVTARNASVWRPHTLSVALIRPDHYVAAHDDNAGLTNVRAHLSKVTGSARTSAVSCAEGH